MNEYEKEMLYIPLGLKTRNEIFEGFGKEELIKTVISTIIGIILDFILYMITNNMTLCIIIILVVISTSVMFLTKDKTNLSVVDHTKNIINFMKMQKTYSYKYFKEQL